MTVTTLGAFPGANDKDKSARIPAAIAAVNRALAGDMTALTYMQAQKVGSATAVGKEAFRRALEIYDQNKPTPAQPATIDPSVQAPKPLPVPGVTTGGVAPPHIGFTPEPPDLSHPPMVTTPGISIHGVAPGIIQEVTIGRPLVDPVVTRRPLPAPRVLTIPNAGGVYSGPPQDDSGTAIAPASSPAFTTSTTAAQPPASPAADAANKPETHVNGLLVAAILLGGVLLFGMVEGRRK